jgi:RHS repeat-associated protein
VTAIHDGSTLLTGFTYNPDGTVASRTDPSGTTSFTYDARGELTSSSAPSLTSVQPKFTYRLDGLVGTRTWSGSSALGTFTYDSAKRPIGLSISGTAVAAMSLAQTYDRGGKVTSESRNFAQIPSGNAGQGTQSFTYDGLGRVKTDVLGSRTITYSYDRDSNRLSVNDSGVSTLYVYDATDQLYSETAGGYTGYARFDPYGNMTVNPETGSTATTAYTYDAADRLTAITPPPALAGAATFTFDALGRTATRTTATTPAATVDTYSYLGDTQTVVRISTKVGTANPTLVDSLVGSDQSRLGTKAGSLVGLLIPDLHGNVAAAANSTLSSTTDALRYDAWGDVVASVTSALPTPWRYQGRLLVDPAGASDLYDSGARYYSPGLGIFTGFDTVSGSAQNPISMNRYLYAAADPTTLIDPDGHCWGICISINPVAFVQSAAQTVGNATVAALPVVAAVATSTVAAATVVAVDTATSNPIGAGVFVAATTVAGAAGAAASDVASGHMPDPEHVMSGAVAGFTYGAVYDVTKSPTAAGAASGAAGDAFTQVWNIAAGAKDANGNPVGFDWGELGAATALGAGTGFIGGRIASRFGGQSGQQAAAGGGGEPESDVPEDDQGASCPVGVGGLSFSADTTVATAAGTGVAISSLRVGDKVEAYDPKSGVTAAHTVDAVMVHTDPVVEHLATDAGEIETTPNHPFFTTDRGWVEAGSLFVGEQLRTESGKAASVIGFTLDATPTAMWDLTVDGAHSFFVDSAGVLVHNQDCGGTNVPNGATPARFVAAPDGIIDTESPALNQQIDDVQASLRSTGSPPPGVRQGGLPGRPGVFGNRSGALPAQPESYYTESDVWPGTGS